MTKTNKEKTIKKVRKEIELSKNFGKMEDESNTDSNGYKEGYIEGHSMGYASGVEAQRKASGVDNEIEYGIYHPKTTFGQDINQIKEIKNAITAVVVWLSILTVLAIYKSI